MPLYVANIIDYFRAYFLYVAWVQYVEGDAWKFVAYYAFSYLLDAFDGMAARALNQTSKLGIYLDMVIDRISSSLALHIAASQVLVDFTGPESTIIAATLYAALVMVEVVSHGVVMYISEVGGFHQKEMDSQNAIVRAYLDQKPVLFWSCVSFEATVLCLIVSKPLWALPFLPGFAFRSLANLLRLRDVLALRAPKKTD